MNWILWVCIFLLVACATTSKRRQLTDEEIDKYELKGVVSDVKICPTAFDQALKVSKIIGKCQIINCTQSNEKIACFSEAE